MPNSFVVANISPTVQNRKEELDLGGQQESVPTKHQWLTSLILLLERLRLGDHGSRTAWANNS
jgi:hypothetical protein